MVHTAKSSDADSLAREGYWPAVANEYFVAGKYSKAVELCLRMLDDQPDVVSGRVILARSLYHAGQFQQAREQFVRVLKYDADNMTALKYLGDILFRAGEEAAAMAYYRRIFEIDPYCRGLSCPIEPPDSIETRQLTIRRPEENAPEKKPSSLREPAFITETIGDIYREQGYLQLAREVYSRLLKDGGNGGIAAKLKETEDELNKKEGMHESTYR